MHSQNEVGGLIDECYIDYRDINFNLYSSPDIVMKIVRRPNASRDSLVFKFLGNGGIDVNIQDSRITNKTIKMWERVGTNNPNAYEGSPNRGLFESFSEYTDYPIDATQFGGTYHINPGLMSLNLEIQNNHHAKINAAVPFIVNDSARIILKKSNTADTNARIYVQEDGELRFKNAAALILKDLGLVVVEAGGKLVMENHSRLILYPNSEIRIKPGGVFCNEGTGIKGDGRIIYEGGSIHHIMCSTLADFTISDSVKIRLDSNAVLEIPDSTTISFFGNESGLIMSPTSVIKMGVNSKLLFDSSSTLIAKGATFTSLDSTGKWEGIVLQNSGSDTISNCTFTNAKTSLAFLNSPGHTFTTRVVKNNVFNIPSGSDNTGIYGENNFRITIQDNAFNMPANPSSKIFGVFLKNSNTEGVESLPEENEPAPDYRMFLINNTFNNGSVSMMLLNYTSSYLPFYVKGNICNSASSVGIVGRNLTGTFKDNIISNTGSLIPMGIHLIASSPDFYNNTITSEEVSLHTMGSSYPNLKPIVSGSNLIWAGGKNRFTSIQSDNIQLANIGSAYTNLGENRFTVDTLSGGYHIYGLVNSTVDNYIGNNNCWYPGGNPRIHLRWSDTTAPIDIRTGLTGIDCDREINPGSWAIDYIGNGIYDSVKQSSDTAGSELTEEEQLYIQGQNYISAGLNIEAISSLKDLIDSYNYFEDLPASVYDLYTAYEYLDTTSVQSYRNTLYGNLKIYLEDKIETEGDYDAEFKSNVYNITLMCDANMENYDDASNGYEFIALFHPDPDIRLNASWDYAEIEALMGGGYGGGERELKITNEELRIEELNGLSEIQEINELKRINEIISNDPIMSKMKAVYENISKVRTEKNEKIEKQISQLTRANEKSNSIGKENSLKSEQLKKQTETDKFKNDKARRNIFELNNLNKQELEKRRIEDMFLSAKDVRNTVSEINRNLNNLLEFKLYQNYPNPFNPVTKFSFDLPKDAKVKLTVYDLLGREVKSIVNSQLTTGKYTFEFDGSNFSSGIYFYELETETFSQTKKMLLIK